MTDDAPSPPLRGTLLAGSAWMVCLRWAAKLTGLVNTAVLARLLTPADFGLIAMSTIVVGIITILFEVGVDFALIQKPDATPRHFHAAWTIRLLQTLAVSGFVLALAPMAGRYYGDPRVAAILPVLCLGVVIKGLTNIGVVSFRRDLDFAREFRYQIITKLLSTAVTITLAFGLRTYWALVYGIVAAAAIEMVLSYVMHPFRPRAALAGGSAIWSFSKWMIVMQVGNFLSTKIDRLILGPLVPTRLLGIYSLGHEVADMAGIELIGPISRSLAPGFAKLKLEPKRLNRAFLKALSATGTVGLPAAIGVAMVANELVPILLGHKWIDAIPLVQIFAINSAAWPVWSILSNLAMVTDRISMLSVVTLVRGAVFVALIYPVFHVWGVTGVAFMKVMTTVISFVVLAAMIARVRAVPVATIFAQIARPFAGTAIMAAAVWGVGGALGHGIYQDLVVKVAVGVVTYTASVLALWHLTGRPDGIESEIVDMLRPRLVRWTG